MSRKLGVWGEVAKIAVPGAALIAAVLAAVFAAYGHQTRLEELELSRDGDVTDRYTKAVGQLADTKPAISLGGLFALERIHGDSQRDRATIERLLEAFIVEETAAAAEAERSAEPASIPIDPALPAAAVGVAPRASPTVVAAVHLAGADLTDGNLTRANLGAVKNLLEAVGLAEATGIDAAIGLPLTFQPATVQADPGPTSDSPAPGEHVPVPAPTRAYFGRRARSLRAAQFRSGPP